MHRFTTQARQGLERITPIFRQEQSQNHQHGNNSNNHNANGGNSNTGPGSTGNRNNIHPHLGGPDSHDGQYHPLSATGSVATIMPAPLPDKALFPTMVSSLPPAPAPIVASSPDTTFPLAPPPSIHPPNPTPLDDHRAPRDGSTMALPSIPQSASSSLTSGHTSNSSNFSSFNRQHITPPGTLVSMSFNVPLNSSIQGPDVADVIFSTAGALERWTFPSTAQPALPVYALPVHTHDVDQLRSLCNTLSTESQGMLHAEVLCSESKTVPGLQRGPLHSLVTNVSIHGEVRAATRTRGIILGRSPIMMKTITIPIDKRLLVDADNNLTAFAANELHEAAKETKTDIFILRPNNDTDETGDSVKAPPDRRLRCVIYGVIKGLDQAKLRVLTMVDRLLGRYVTAFTLNQALHPLVCGTSRKLTKRIEYETESSIFFPSSLGRLLGCVFPGIEDAPDDQFRICSATGEGIQKALDKLISVMHSSSLYSKDISINPSKIDSILLERLDTVRQIMIRNASYITLPGLGQQPGVAQVRAANVLNIERTSRDLMNLASQFYSADWRIMQMNPFHELPSIEVIQEVLTDISITSGAEITLERLIFHINGLDDAVKAALEMISEIPWVKFAESSIRIKLEIASEHKEFVSGKKNGKINKIMNQSRTQIVFDGFNDYNFFIDVRGLRYQDVKCGLDLVEQELPASISFHVPDQYHKRIIGMGGQNIQRIMKKYSVFVKFSNAMDRDGSSRDEADFKIDNVVCRTPARNAQSLDLVKQEIMEMVEKCDAEFVSEHVIIDRLYHRVLISKLPDVEFLERKWNCHVLFPSTEDASDVVTITGPEYQIPQAVDELLRMVLERHEVSFKLNHRLNSFLASAMFKDEVVHRLRSRFLVAVSPESFVPYSEKDFIAQDEIRQSIYLSYTRNNAGGLRDAIDYLISQLCLHGLDILSVKGVIPRPMSDSFKDSLPFFASKLFPPSSAASSTRSSNPPASSSRFFAMFRRPGAITSFSSLIGRKPAAAMSHSSLFHPMNNMSRNSIASFDSVATNFRNPWNDSGVNLPDDASWMSSRNSGRRSRILWTPQPSYSQLPITPFIYSNCELEGFGDKSSISRRGRLSSSRGGSSTAGVFSLNEEPSSGDSVSSASGDGLHLLEDNMMTMKIAGLEATNPPILPPEPASRENIEPVVESTVDAEGKA